jgi:hypothetical protein
MQWVCVGPFSREESVSYMQGNAILISFVLIEVGNESRVIAEISHFFKNNDVMNMGCFFFFFRYTS